MAEWIYFLHPPRDNFAATMTEEEQAAFAAHAEWLRRLLADGVLILAGPTLGRINTGVGIFEAPDEETARAIVAEDRWPAAASPGPSCAPISSGSCAAATDARSPPARWSSRWRRPGRREQLFLRMALGALAGRVGDDRRQQVRTAAGVGDRGAWLGCTPSGPLTGGVRSSGRASGRQAGRERTGR